MSLLPAGNVPASAGIADFSRNPKPPPLGGGVFTFLELVTNEGIADRSSAFALTLATQAIGIGGAVGVGMTLVGMWFLKQCEGKGWVTETWHQLPVPAPAVACFAVAQWLGGSGFIACFVGGLLFGWLGQKHKHKLLLAAEGTGDTMALITWVIFGAGVVGQAISSFRWEIVLYAIFSLTIIRMMPVFLALSGIALRTDEKLFIGWFGPRGLASIVFGVIVINEHLPGGGTIAITVVCTIILSIIGHGLSANPLVKSLVERSRRKKA